LHSGSGSVAGDHVGAASSSPPNYLVAGLVVTLLAGGLAAIVNLRDREPTAEGWRSMVLPTTAQQPESDLPTY
jgi:hypothetical protein